YDLDSSPIRQLALLAADQSDAVAATSPITLFGVEGAVSRGFLAFRAVSAPGAADAAQPPALLGYVQATFANDQLINSILSNENAIDLHLQISDVTPSAGDAGPAPVYESANPAVGSVIRQSTFDVGGRTWQVSASAADASVCSPQPWTPLLLLVA